MSKRVTAGERRALVIAVAAIGFACGMIAVWLAAEGIFRLARVGPPSLPGTPGAGAEWRAYGRLLVGVLAALLTALGCVHVLRRLGGEPPSD